jgi:hypothetical protein
VGGLLEMSITVSKEFITAFNFCMKEYGVIGEELEFEKQRVRENYEDAERCYLAIYGDLIK